jgi:hypothetical protein
MLALKFFLAGFIIGQLSAKVQMALKHRSTLP